MGTVITDPALLAEIEAASVNAPAAKSGMIPFSPEWKEAQDRMAYKEAFDEGSGFDQFMAGVGKPVMQLEAGVMNLLGLGDDEYQAEAEQGTTMMEEQHGIPALAGNIVGETAMLALPATKAAQGTLGAMKGYSGLSKAAGTIAAESGLVGGYEFLKEPESDETRLGNAAEAAAWTAVLGAPFSAIRGSRDSVSDTARELLDEGVPLTPGMASETGMATTAERFMSNIPILGRKVKALQDAAIENGI